MRDQSYKPNFVVEETGPLGCRVVAGAEAIGVAHAAFEAALPRLSHDTGLVLRHGARVIRQVPALAAAGHVQAGG